MKASEFAKLIINEREFDIKSRYFGECRIICGEDFIVLYDDTKAPALEIARWRKEYIANYVDYLANADKRHTISAEQAYKIINSEQSIFEKIFSFISAVEV